MEIDSGYGYSCMASFYARCQIVLPGSYCRQASDIFSLAEQGHPMREKEDKKGRKDSWDGAKN